MALQLALNVGREAVPVRANIFTHEFFGLAPPRSDKSIYDPSHERAVTLRLGGRVEK